MATDAALVAAVGLARVLTLAPSTYYRKRAIELAMGSLPSAELLTICHDYPQELVWAVYDQRRTDYLDTLLIWTGLLSRGVRHCLVGILLVRERGWG